MQAVLAIVVALSLLYCPVMGEERARVVWYHDYAEAVRVAEREKKLLFLFFYQPDNAEQKRFEEAVLANDEVEVLLSELVCAKLPLDAKVRVKGGESVVLLEHPAFAELQRKAGIAMIDFRDPDAKYYGRVVSVFPFLNGKLYSVAEVRAMLELPPGTLTQRTLIYAVRTHPEKPASANGVFDPYLAQEAERHSLYQARIQLQGHHSWEERFHRINARLPGGLVASEVCAESWPGQGLLEAAIECVRCWRLSSGHWAAVRAFHPRFGYDMKRGRNGVWYATGIFATPLGKQ